MEKQNKFIGYVGTYTKGASEGIYSFTLDTNEGKISDVKVAAKLDNPTYLTISNDNKYLYAVAKKGDLGGVAAFSRTDQLTFVNQQLSEGAPPCHVSVDSQNRYLFTGNYHKGTIEAYTLQQENGSIAPNPSVAQHQGSGPDKRQEKPHAHYAAFTPDEKYVAAIDLGIDQLITYELNHGQLKEVSRLTVKPGSGPRHLVFHPSENIAYLMTEFSSEVLVLQYNPEDGSFAQLQAVSTIPADFTENNQGSAIHISADGKFVYAGNRGHNSIAVLKVNEENQQLSLVEYTPSEGDWPRDFVLDPTNQFIVGSNQESSNLVLFKRDGETGKLTLLNADITVPHAVCVKFLNY
ncbi:6-phosphogluconolactonase [Evansella caseinilytica]|uniref:6-phosphogluconolactonase n=1 Tax=Evansella caseinilytica TaxID=1503961 RepID=A0A1H3IE04_9BACI|nr:lactonase family protein [Evansella caseinilytica]SDY25318.1 6-phosphogluconolactonase [Evansella caseinilytica]